MFIKTLGRYDVMYKNTYDAQLNNIFIKYANINFEAMPELKNKHFFSSDIGLSARDLVVILKATIDIFKIKNYEEFVVGGEFSTFNKILEFILKTS